MFGREPELARIRGFLTAGGGPTAVVIEGAAGIGKTSLWDSALAIVDESATLVLSCRPTAAEAGLSFSALRDLLEPVVGEHLPALPAAQSRALAAALLIEPDDSRHDERLIGVATLAIVRQLAARSRLLIAIDDGHWLDPGSVAALSHAVRRLRGEPVTILQALRSPHPDRLELERAGRWWKLARVQLGPLDIDTLHAVVRARLGVAVPRPTMLRVGEISAGNPFFAIELIRSLPSSVGRVSSRDIVLPHNLLSLVENRVRGLDQPVRDVLAAVAALASPSLALLEAVFPEAADHLVAAEREQIIQFEGARPRFTHPLLAAAALETVGRLDRARLHRRLAAVVAEPEQRARHLAEGTLEADEAVAYELEQTARASAARGAPGAAAELVEHSIRLTPAQQTEARHRRMLEAARAQFAAGNQDRSRALFAELRGELPPGAPRARVLVDNIAVSGDGWLGVALAEQALIEADGDISIQVDANRWLSQGWLHAADVARGLEHARKAARLAEQLDDPVRLVQCLGTLCQFEAFTGQLTPGLVERAVALEQETPGALLHHSPTQFLGQRLLWNDRLSAARPWLEAALTRAEEEGPEPDRAIQLLWMADLELRAGNWAMADAYASALYELDAQIFGLNERSYYVRALVSAHLGRVEEVRATMAEDEPEALGLDGPTTFFKVLGRWALGFLELSLDNFARAAELLGPLPAILEQMGYRNPGARPVLPDAIEALIAVGRHDEARHWADLLAERGSAFDNPWAVASAGRCAGMLSAADGDTAGAVTTLEGALVEHERSENPFARARTLFALGATLRRAKQKRSAREALLEALDTFDTLGAAVWAEKASSELARIGGRQPSGGHLTVTERRIAALVSEGRPNKAIADELYVTVRTVETHVRHIYDKLGVRSRAELAGRIARESAG